MNKDGPKYCRVQTTIWTNSDFTSLPSAAQRLYLLILSQPELTLCGVLQPAFKRWSKFSSDTTAADLELACKELEAREFVHRDDETDELLVRSFVRHGVAMDSENSLVGMTRAYETIHSKVLRKVVIEELGKDLDHDLNNRLNRRIGDGVKKALRDRVSKTFLREWETGL
jgi:hypothetical protein